MDVVRVNEERGGDNGVGGGACLSDSGAFIKGELDIGDTVLQPADLQFMLREIKFEPVDDDTLQNCHNSLLEQQSMKRECFEGTNTWENRSSNLDGPGATRIGGVSPTANDNPENIKETRQDVGNLHNEKRNSNNNNRSQFPERRYECDICHKSFITKCYVKRHLYTHAKQRSSNQCRKILSLKNKSKANITDERPYPCDLCIKSFRTNTVLMWHKRWHTKVKSYCCDICQAMFSSKTSMVLHLKYHNSERPYVCHICSKDYKSFTHLRTHEFIHTGVLPFKCDSCKKKFRDKVALKRHLQIHSSERPRPYTCYVCEKSFYENSKLKRHELIHIGELLHFCRICKKGFIRKSGLQSHMNTHRG